MEKHPAAATLLANLGWCHISQSIFDAFCAKHKIDVMRECYGQTHDVPSELVN
jgi:hypothetical protein